METYYNNVITIPNIIHHSTIANNSFVSSSYHNPSIRGITQNGMRLIRWKTRERVIITRDKKAGLRGKNG